MPETTPGGRALKFYASVRLEVRPKEIIKKDGNALSRKAQIKAVKNKVAPPFRQAEVDIEFGRGISKEGEILDMGYDLGVVGRSGAWYSYEGEKLGQGRDNVKELLRSNPELMKEIDNKIRELLYPEIEETDER